MLLNISPHRRGTLTLPLALLAGLAFAQEPAAKITCNTARVQGLQYDSASQGQLATWTFTASMTNFSGQLYAYEWYLDGTSQVSGPQYTSWTLKVSGPGKHIIMCTPIASGTTASGTMTVAAIGGPLSTNVTAGFGGAGQVPSKDQRDSSQPWYLQYFGYTYNPGQDKPDPLLQTPQTGQAQVSGQLAGTTYTWSINGNAVITNAPTPSTTSIALSASGSSGTGSIQAKCTYTYTDPTDSTLTGSADDDTDQLPNSLQYRFTAHLPSTTNQVTLSSTVIDSPQSCHADAVMQLKDHLGQGMPGVIVQERFPNLATEVQRHSPDSPPSDESVNDSNTYWVTGLFSGSPTIDGCFGGVDANGWEAGVDDFSLSLPYASTPNGVTQWPIGDHPGDPWVILTQQYFAGTRNATPGAFGIDVGTWTIQKWTDSISHG